MASTSRRIPPKQPAKTRANADQLANDLAKKLTIGTAKGKQKASNEATSPKSTKLESMRSINAASQALSTAVQSGWKNSSTNPSKVTLNTVNSSAKEVTRHLETLRRLCPGDIDVERAAASVLGKLVALEMHDLASSFLPDMHCRLLNFLHVQVTEPASNLGLLSIPEPLSRPTDPVILNLVSTYLMHALILATRNERSSVVELATALDAPAHQTLLHWLPHFSTLPTKHVDSLLTRAYSCLTKMSSSTEKPLSKPKTPSVAPSPQSLFSLRMYALQCLIHTSSGIIEANTFWDQATKSAFIFAKSTTSTDTTEDDTTRSILARFDTLSELATRRQDVEAFMATDETSKGFIAFCDQWASFAKMAGDIALLQRINLLLRRPSSSSDFSSPTKSTAQDANSLPGTKPSDLLDLTKLCNALVQLSLQLEKVSQSPEADDLVVSLARECGLLLSSSTYSNISMSPKAPPSEKRSRQEQELNRMHGKADRATEKVRRMAVKTIEQHGGTLSVKVDQALGDLLLTCVASLESMLSDQMLPASAARDAMTRALDTLFVLSRVKLNANNPTSFVTAFELLVRASSILDLVPVDRHSDDDPIDIANYTRCVSGAFYNLAGTLYQASRFGSAVPFLVESCTLGQKALQLPRAAQEVPNETREKEWMQLEEQLFRRWELLAVCYSKNGDRKKAFDSFTRAIHAFPFESSGLTTQSNTLALDALFGPYCTSPLKQLATLVDRVSYIGACELLLPPEEVSLRPRGIALSPDSCPPELSVVGAIIERQLDSLESSRWKDGVKSVFLQLLKDALDVYSTKAKDGSILMPVRRARVLIRCLELIYRDGDDSLLSGVGLASVEEVEREIDGLGTLKAFGKDASLNHFITQYRIESNLWVALLAHQRVDPEQSNIMSLRSDEACRLMKELIARGSKISTRGRKSTDPGVVRKSGSPKLARIVSPKASRATRQRIPAAPKKAAPIRKTKAYAAAPSTPKARSKNASQALASNTTKTPRQSVDPSSAGMSPLAFDAFERFLSLLQLTARILGFLSLVLAKAHILDMTRRVAERHLGPASDGYVIASLDLAHQYVALGKLKRAASIFNQALEIVRNHGASSDVSVRFLLRFSESLALFEDVPKSSAVYLEALELSSHLEFEPKGLSTQQRIHARVKMLEVTATAAHVFSLVQHTNGNVSVSLESLLQSLRLWNRAVDTLIRLRPTTGTADSASDPFEMSALKEALPVSAGSSSTQERVDASVRVVNQKSPVDGLELRVSEGLLSTLFSLTEVYFLRGSAREAEYFARQATDLATQLNAPAMASRALGRQAELQLNMGQLDTAHANLTKAASLLANIQGLDTAHLRRIHMEYNSRMSEADDAENLFGDTLSMLSELDMAFRQFDNLTFGLRKSPGSSPAKPGELDIVAPELLASILSQQLWSLRDEIGDEFDAILEKFMSLSNSNRTKAQENALMARLTLHSVYGRFRADMFLSSLTESTIAIPMGMESKEKLNPSLPSMDVVEALANAEKLLWSQLNLTAATGNTIKVREAVLSLVLVNAFRTSLGDRRQGIPSVMAALLDASTALSLRKDMLDAIDHKFPQIVDDLRWSSLSGDGNPVPRTADYTSRKARKLSLSDSDSESDDDLALGGENIVQNYWTSVRAKYQSLLLNPSTLSSSETAGLPDNWTVITINVTPDEDTLICSRRLGGSDPGEPLIFCIPLNRRRDHGTGEDEEDQLTFGGAIHELQDIVRCSDECTKAAIRIRSDDEEARSNWWKQRGQLDTRMRELVENIEYCWLGAFKTILSPRSLAASDLISDLRVQFERVFHRSLHIQDKSRKPGTHKKSASQTQMHTPSQFSLEEAIVRCFSALSPKCRDEELEDVVYFVLDLYQFHGVPVAIAEIDIDQVVIDLRAVLEEYAAKVSKQDKAAKASMTSEDEHLFLILDKNVQGLPWESMPILRGRSVSRIPGVQFLHDRLAFAKCRREAVGQRFNPKDGAPIDPRKGYYILNPSGDLGRTEERFKNWASGMKKAGWDGIVGQSVSEQQFVNALQSRDLVVYFGHGGGEQYVRSHRIRALPKCAATMLWGCSSGALRDMGNFDRTGTPYNYMLAGCPTLVANLWDVTDKDIDKFSQSVFDKLALNGKGVTSTSENHPRKMTSLVTAVAESRDSCKLKYLTGAAPVVYGIPFYL